MVVMVEEGGRALTQRMVMVAVVVTVGATMVVDCESFEAKTKRASTKRHQHCL